MRTSHKHIPGTVLKIYQDLSLGTCCFTLILVYTYTSLSKLLQFSETKRQMLGQPLPEPVASELAWLIPAAELLTVLLLALPGTRKAGYLCSSILLALFSFYVAMVLLKLTGDAPCTCGGLISYLSWDRHLLFNISLLILSVSGLIIKERR